MKFFLFMLINAVLAVVTGCIPSSPKATANRNTTQPALVAKTSNGSGEQNNAESGIQASGNRDTAGTHSNQPPEAVLEVLKANTLNTLRMTGLYSKESTAPLI